MATMMDRVVVVMVVVIELVVVVVVVLRQTVLYKIALGTKL